LTETAVHDHVHDYVYVHGNNGFFVIVSVDVNVVVDVNGF